MAAAPKAPQRSNGRGSTRTLHPARTARVVFGVASGATYVALAATIGWAAHAEAQTNAEAANLDLGGPESLALADDLFAGAATPAGATDDGGVAADSILPLVDVTATAAETTSSTVIVSTSSTEPATTTPATPPTAVVSSAPPGGSGTASTQPPGGQPSTSQPPTTNPATTAATAPPSTTVTNVLPSTTVTTAPPSTTVTTVTTSSAS